MGITYRSDVAGELFEHLGGRIDGVDCEKFRLCSMDALRVTVNTREAAEKLGKSVGDYYTLSLDGVCYRSHPRFEYAVRAVGALIRRCLPSDLRGGVLVAALGNPDITPDAVGSLAASSLLVTRHISGKPGFERFSKVSLCRTGVLGTTVVESAVEIKALCDSIHPSAVIAVDALAGGELSALCRSIQVCNTGISPGSGVGNDRAALDREFLGVDVVAVGVPTVMDASGICASGECADMFITPRNIDSLVRCVSRIIGYGINLALHDGLSVEDVDALIG